MANRTAEPVAARVLSTSNPPQALTWRPGDVRPLFTDDPVRLEFEAEGLRRSYALDANSAYFFGGTRSGGVDLQKIGLNGDANTQRGRRLPGAARTTPSGVVTLKVLVDEEEAMRRELWERRLKRRVAEASRILESHAGVSLRVVAVEEWRSSNQKRRFPDTLQEFEELVDPSPARLAIGFTSQYEAPRGRVHLGGIRGPLRRHLLVREWSKIIGEREKLEVLLHELGHFLGATHSPERDSVMRPVLGDRRSRLAGFQIRFDAVNTLIMAMVGEEMRRRGTQDFLKLSAGTRTRLEQIYRSVEGGVPGDSSASRFRQLASAKTAEASLAGQTRQVLAAVTAAAAANQRLPELERLRGDLLTERCVQAAAAEAAKLPDDSGREAFLLAIALGVGDADTLLRGLQRQEFRAVETPASRAYRLSVLGRPTVLGRRDLAQHMMVSAGLTAGADADHADTLGLAKEALDAQGGSGFSFVDLAANRAGVRFAQRVLSGEFRLHTIAAHFRLAHYMPPIDGLPEGLAGREVAQRFGGKGDERFDAQMAIIESRIDALPAYAAVVFNLAN